MDALLAGLLIGMCGIGRGVRPRWEELVLVLEGEAVGEVVRLLLLRLVVLGERVSGSVLCVCICVVRCFRPDGLEWQGYYIGTKTWILLRPQHKHQLLKTTTSFS